MLRQCFIYALLSCFTASFGQSPNNALLKIKTISEAQLYLEQNPNVKGKLFSIESKKDTAEILLPLFNKKTGFTFSIENDNYKILETDSVLSFRVCYIYLNGEQLNKAQVDSVRQVIISSYNSDVSFFDLVQQYNMDGNPTGDTGWFTENMMAQPFEDAVRSHKKGDIFIVDTPDLKWYHVVLKTFDDTYNKKLTLLKIISE